jgi:hypothetical protein
MNRAFKGRSVLTRICLREPLVSGYGWRYAGLQRFHKDVFSKVEISRPRHRRIGPNFSRNSDQQALWATTEETICLF